MKNENFNMKFEKSNRIEIVQKRKIRYIIESHIDLIKLILSLLFRYLFLKHFSIIMRTIFIITFIVFFCISSIYFCFVFIIVMRIVVATKCIIRKAINYIIIIRKYIIFSIFLFFFLINSIRTRL